MATAETVVLDLETITLGEMASAEMASGRDFSQLLKGKVTRLLLAVYLHDLRHSAEPRSWRDLSSLHLSDVKSSDSPSSQDNPSPTSSV